MRVCAANLAPLPRGDGDLVRGMLSLYSEVISDAEGTLMASTLDVVRNVGISGKTAEVINGATELWTLT